jgi:hypothetical protein
MFDNRFDDRIGDPENAHVNPKALLLAAVFVASLMIIFIL